jgi:hypothetical protein
MRRIVVIVIGVLLAGAAAAEAQIVSPTALEFESPDHNSPLSKPTSYTVDFFAEGATAPTQSPSVAATALTPVAGTSPQRYRIAFAQLTSYPAGQVFTAKVRAVNVGGSSDPSLASDSFGKPGRPAPTSKPSLVP